jgi:hypothetical protein
MPNRDGARRASEEAIKAISGHLTEKKAVLARPSGLAKIAFPDMSSSLGEIIRRSKDLTNQRPEPEVSSSFLDPPPVRLPDASPPDGSSHIDHPREERLGVATSMGGHSSSMITANGSSTPVGRGVTPASSPASQSAGSSGGVSEASKQENVVDPRIASQRAKRVAGGGLVALGSAGDNHPRPEPGLALRSDATSVVGEEPHTKLKGSSLSSKVTLVDLPPESGGLKTTKELRTLSDLHVVGARASRSEFTVDHESSSASHAGPSAISVRNPLSSDLRNISLASSALTEGTRNLSDHGGKRRGFLDDSSDRTTSPRDGTSIDLSKTNELLQQLIDAVRKQRDSSLPIGGPSVYPGR